MRIFEKKVVVTKNDLDQLNHVNNVRYVQWVQDIAEAHWLQNASKEILDNYFWVMLNHNINYKNQAVLGEELHIKTFVLKSEGLISERQVEFYNYSTDKLIVTSLTRWCFMSRKTKKPVRIPKEITELFD